MHVISKRPFADAMKKYPNDAAAIEATYNVLNRGEFKTPEALKAVFRTLDNFKYKDKTYCTYSST